jgi:molybdopterin/thiamine biosynthesis adenylyltransferase
MAGKRVVVVGSGGNIGSQLIGHLGRMREDERIVLIDPGRYEAENLWTQEIDRRDLGKSKVSVQTRKLRRIRPDLSVKSIPSPVEKVPLGRLRADLILSCLDSRISRMVLNRAALRLDVPWFDAGVQGDSLLARVSMYRPGSTRACMICGWDQRDFELVEQVYACGAHPVPDHPTHSPSSLGALAASLQALQCQKYLSGKMSDDDLGREILLEADHHTLYLTSYARNLRCRISDHRGWTTRPLHSTPDEVTLADALELGPASGGNGVAPRVRVDGSPFIVRQTCPRCGRKKPRWRHEASLSPKENCESCGTMMVTTSADRREELEAGQLPGRLLRRSLRSFGLRRGDIFSVGTSRAEKHYELVL